MTENYLAELLRESLICKKLSMFNSALTCIILTIEYSMIEALKASGIDVYEKSRKNEKYYHTLTQLIDEAHTNKLISQKMVDRLKAINIIRRMGTHSKSGQTIRGDVEMAYDTFGQLLNEINCSTETQSGIVNDLISKINSIENEVKNQKNTSFMGLTHRTNEIKRTYVIDAMLDFMLLVCDKDILLVMGIIAKYRPRNVEYLRKLLKPFDIEDDRVNAILRILVVSGAVFIGHPYDVRVSDPNLAPIKVRDDLFSELQKYFKASWPIIFKNYKGIEGDYDKPRDI